jgi:predicted CoA-binding protein
MKWRRTLTPEQLLSTSKSILVIDWPSRDVPDALTHAGFAVVVRGGPGEDEYAAYETNNDGVVSRRVTHAPDHIDLIYSHRPLDELSKIIALAQRLRAKALWIQSGLTDSGGRDAKGCWMPEQEALRARGMVTSAGLELLTQPYIGDVAREFRLPR